MWLPSSSPVLLTRTLMLNVLSTLVWFGEILSELRLKFADDDEIAFGDEKVKDRGTPEQLGHSVNDWTHQLLNGLPNGPLSFHYPAVEIATDFSLA